MGWSESYQIGINQDPWNAGNYVPANATWFQRSWWNKNHWVWIYHNDTQMSLRLASASFMGCAGHSNGKYYSGAPGVGATLLATGGGCTFTSAMYVVDANGTPVGSMGGLGSCDVPTISVYNCYYGGYGRVCTRNTTTSATSFGSPSYFGPNTGYYSYGRCQEARTINYPENVPIIPPQGRLYLHIYPTGWHSSSPHCLLVLQGKASSLDAKLEPADIDYVWIMTPSGWKKEKKAFMRTNTGWEEIKGQ